MTDKHIYRVLSNNTEKNSRSLEGFLCCFYANKKQRQCSQCRNHIKIHEYYYKCLDNHGALPKADESDIKIVSSYLHDITHGHGESVCVACIKDTEIIGTYSCEDIHSEGTFIPSDAKFVLKEN